MQNVLADLAIESEASTAALFRVARAFDEGDEPLRRFGTAVMKYWICKRAAGHANEALECFGGNGYAEESGMPLLYRDAPLMSIWEGSGNVAALDALRAIGREPAALEVFFEEIGLAAGADSRLDDAVARLYKELSDLDDIEYRARRVVEQLALVFQGSLLVRHAPAAVADAFCATRFGGDHGVAFGTLPPGVDTAAILDRCGA